MLLRLRMLARSGPPTRRSHSRESQPSCSPPRGPRRSCPVRAGRPELAGGSPGNPELIARLLAMQGRGRAALGDDQETRVLLGRARPRWAGLIRRLLLSGSASSILAVSPVKQRGACSSWSARTWRPDQTCAISGSSLALADLRHYLSIECPVLWKFSAASAANHGDRRPACQRLIPERKRCSFALKPTGLETHASGTWVL